MPLSRVQILGTLLCAGLFHTANLQELRLSTTDVYAESLTDKSTLVFPDRQGTPFPILFAESAAKLFSDSECGRQAERFLHDLRRGQDWAARMYDASSKLFPDGILVGNVQHYGNFDECYEGGTEGIETRYCLIDIEHQKGDRITFYRFSRDTVQNISIVDFPLGKSVWRPHAKARLRISLCVPSACSAAQVELSLRKSESFFTDTSWLAPSHVSVNSSFCQSNFRLQQRERRAHSYSVFALLYCVFVSSLCVLIFVGSTWKTSGSGSGTASSFEKILACFSVRRNIQSIMTRENSFEILELLDFPRTALTLCVIFAHRFYFNFPGAVINGQHLKASNWGWPFLLLANGTIMTDVFFCTGAIIATISWLESLDKGKCPQFTRVIAKRYMRLTPSYALVIGFYIFILPYLGTGPLWSMAIEYESHCCSENWWINLIYANNYFAADRMCLFQSWYLSVDFQAHCIAYWVIRIFWKLPRPSGYSFLMTLILGACCWTTLVSYVQQAPASFFLWYEYNNLREIPYFLQYYVKTHLRIAAYLVGVLTGAIVYDLRRKNHWFPGIWSLATYLFATTIFFTVYFWPIRTSNSRLELALYAGFNRSLSSLAYSGIFVSIVFNDGAGKRIRKFLSPTWLVPLAKLTYGAFLVHNVNQLYNFATMRTAKYLSLYTMIIEFFCDVSISCLIALMLWIMIEAPARNLCQLLWWQRECEVRVPERSSMAPTKVD